MIKYQNLFYFLHFGATNNFGNVPFIKQKA